MRYILILVICNLLFSGCSYSNNTKNNLDLTTDFDLISKKLSREVCRSIKENSILYVTDFVNESNLKNISKLGFLLSNELQTNVLKSSCSSNISIKSLQLSKSLHISKQGTRILTRELKDLKIKNLKEDRQILVGTYVITKKQLILFLKLISLKSGNTISTSSVSTNITNEIKELEGIDTNTDPIVYKPFHL